MAAARKSAETPLIRVVKQARRLDIEDLKLLGSEVLGLIRDKAKTISIRDSYLDSYNRPNKKVTNTRLLDETLKIGGSLAEIAKRVGLSKTGLTIRLANLGVSHSMEKGVWEQKVSDEQLAEAFGKGVTEFYNFAKANGCGWNEYSYRLKLMGLYTDEFRKELWKAYIQDKS